MTTRTLLIFELDGARFGVDAVLVREAIQLPELTTVEDVPPHIVGVFSLRGQIVPVTDLNLRFGHPAQPYHLSDQVVVLELGSLLMGLIVSEVIEVITVECGIGNAGYVMIPQSDSLQSAFGNQHSAFEMVRVGDGLVTLLDASQLVHQPQAPLPSPPPRYAQVSEQKLLPPLAGEAWPVLSLSKEDGGSGAEQTSPSRHFCPQATPEQHAVFRARAKVFMEAAAEEEGARLPLAVVELDGEHFGIELEAVQEFCYIAPPVPIPCCPPHILGAIILRGNPFTLLDLRAALNLPRATQSSGKAVIVRASTWLGTGLGEQLIGVALDAVHDVIYLREKELQAVPPALRELHGVGVKGTVPYAGKMMAVLDLPALLAREEWIVNEQC